VMIANSCVYLTDVGFLNPVTVMDATRMEFIPADCFDIILDKGIPDPPY
jgi:hypothetical protein